MRLSLSFPYLVALSVLTVASCGGSDDAPPNPSGSNDAGGLDATSSTQDGNGGTDAPSSSDADTGPVACNATVGFTSPLAACSVAQPCKRTLVDAGAGGLTSSSDAPQCKTTRAGRPVFDDGPARSTMDASGLTTRYACVYSPPGASAAATRPLLVFIHGSSGAADDVYDHTSLRSKAPTFDLSGDPNRLGFFLLAIQARNLHWPTTNAEDGSKHDFFHRHLASPSTNPDIANLDAEIDRLVLTGNVDATRIFVTGWSNGARFAQLYAIARHVTPTAGGNLVRAAAVYSGTDPFNGLADQPECAVKPYPQSTVPIFLVGRACDILPCDQQQAVGLSASLGIDPGDVMETWVNDLKTKVGDPNVQRIIVAGNGSIVNGCTPANLCGRNLALLNHVRWPDGVADNSGIDHEPAMLTFLRTSP